MSLKYATVSDLQPSKDLAWFYSVHLFVQPDGKSNRQLLKTGVQGVLADVQRDGAGGLLVLRRHLRPEAHQKGLPTPNSFTSCLPTKFGDFVLAINEILVKIDGGGGESSSLAFLCYFRRRTTKRRGESFRKIRALTPLIPNTVELIPTLGALFPRGGPVQDPVLTWRGGGEQPLSGNRREQGARYRGTSLIRTPPPPRTTIGP